MTPRSLGAGAAAWIVYASLLPASPSSAQPPPADCPDPAALGRTLREGVDLVMSPRQWMSAEGPLCVAACCLQGSDPSAPVDVRGPVDGYTTPFYYLGRLYSQQEDRPCSTLRSLRLSECRGEMEPDAVKAAYLEDRDARRRVAERAKRALRGAQGQLFKQGLEELRQPEPDFAEAAEHLWRAIQTWDDDGEVVRSSQGRFMEYYIPRSFLAKALLGLECWEAAAAVAECSQLGWCLGRPLQDELGEARQRRASGEPEGEGCIEWRERIAWKGCTDCLACLTR